MSIFKIKSAPVVLIENEYNQNILPLILELTQHNTNTIKLVSYEQPFHLWQKLYKGKQNVKLYDEFSSKLLEELAQAKCIVLISSVNQMALCTGWSECLKHLRKLASHPNVLQTILISHKDAYSFYSKIELNLHHISSAIITYDTKDPAMLFIQVKKNGKVVKTQEQLIYDNKTNTLKTKPVNKEDKNIDEPEKPQPSQLSTFKIEVDQIDKMEKSKLKLPYMSKINEGQGEIHYEPDAVDDWDEEDPDEDLDI